MKNRYSFFRKMNSKQTNFANSSLIEKSCLKYLSSTRKMTRRPEMKLLAAKIINNGIIGNQDL